jgi:hypothetical protein
MHLTLRFNDPGSDSKALVGGKGANLGLCAQPGFSRRCVDKGPDRMSLVGLGRRSALCLAAI